MFFLVTPASFATVTVSAVLEKQPRMILGISE